jgi:hypothetical protein
MEIFTKHIFDLGQARMEGHNGASCITRKGCVHDMFRGLLAPEADGINVEFVDHEISDFMQRLGFHVNGSHTLGELHFTTSELDPSAPFVSGNLLSRRLQEYFISLYDPTHASELTSGSLLQEMSYPASPESDKEYRKLLGHDFCFWALASAKLIVDWCSNPDNVGDRSQQFLDQIRANGLVDLLNSTSQALGVIEEDAGVRYGEYATYLETLLGQTIDWEAVTDNLTPFDSQSAFQLLTIQQHVRTFLNHESVNELAGKISSWVVNRQ